MYTDDDLSKAVNRGIFTEQAVKQFRQLVVESKQSDIVDEENFRLVSGFNDIFVVIACALVLISTLMVFGTEHESLGLAICAGAAWGLAEFFVRIRKLALPAIVLLLAFTGACFGFVLSCFNAPTESHIALASVATVVAAFLHWKRFRVPITVAAGTVAAAGVVVAAVMSVTPEAKNWIMLPLFLCGVLAFALAMAWDISDRQRATYRTDVAFWLHLIAAPLIIHPVFSGLGILSGDADLVSTLVVLGLYLLMTLISLVIDRRAFMVSSLGYVVYALSKLFAAFGGVTESVAVTGIVIGSGLLLLSAFWHKARVQLVTRMPVAIRERVPVIQSAQWAAVAK